MKKRFVFVSRMESSPWGGSEELWSRTALHLAAQGNPVHVSVMAWPEEPPQVQTLRAAGCDVRPRHAPPDGAYWRIHRKFFPVETWGWLKEIKPDAVVLSHGINFVDTCLASACDKAGIPHIMLFQAATEWYWPPQHMVRQSAPWIEKAAAVLCVSEANLEVTRKQYGTKLLNGGVVRNTFNVSFDANPPWPSGDGPFSLACVARLEPAHKGQDVLFEVLAMEKWRQRPLKVVLYGNGDTRESLEFLRARHALSSVTFGGFMQNIETLWANHHGLVLPSRVEGLPVALVEAMLCNRLGIVTNIAGNAEILQDNLSGFVAESPTIRGIDEALERAWDRRNEWQAIGQTAGKHVRAMVPRDPAAALAETLLKLIQ